MIDSAVSVDATATDRPTDPTTRAIRYIRETIAGTLLEAASSTSEDSVSSGDCQSAIRSTAGEMAAGYVSDGDALTAVLSAPLAELSTAELTNGYMSEGGISLYARKMQARFREGLEAVRDSMRRQQADLNDRLAILCMLRERIRLRASSYLSRWGPVSSS